MAAHISSQSAELARRRSVLLASGVSPQFRCPANTASPIRNIRRRPYMSDRLTAVSKNAARVSAYASTIHCRPERLAPSPRWMPGSATVKQHEHAQAHRDKRLPLAARLRRRARPPLNRGLGHPGCSCSVTSHLTPPGRGHPASASLTVILALILMATGATEHYSQASGRSVSCGGGTARKTCGRRLAGAGEERARCGQPPQRREDARGDLHGGRDGEVEQGEDPGQRIPGG